MGRHVPECSVLCPGRLRAVIRPAWLLCLLWIGCVEVRTVDGRAPEDPPVAAAGDGHHGGRVVDAVPPGRTVNPGAPIDDPPELDVDALAVPEPTLAPRQRAGVRLVDAGTQPREVLRWSARRGQRQSVELSMAMEVAMTVGTQEVPPTPIPEIRLVMDTEVLDPGPPIRYRFATRDVRRGDLAEASARVMAAVDEAVAGLAAAKGTIVLDDRGATQSVELDLVPLGASGMKPAMQSFRQSFSQLFPVFPEEPVGKGARWSSVVHFESEGIDIQQTTQYELVNRQGSRIELGLSFEQVASAPGELELGAAKLDVATFGGVGQGTLGASLDAIVPERGRARSRSASRSSVDLGGGAQSILLQTDLELGLAAAAARPASSPAE
jgi:hypothetical protein